MKHEAPRRPSDSVTAGTDKNNAAGKSASADTPPDQGTLPVGGGPGLAASAAVRPGAVELSPTLPGSSTPPPPAAPGRGAGHPLIDLPGYEILGELGRGGMGVVYKGRQTRLKRLVALKMILSGEHARPEDFQRFQTEAEAIARLQHPNIVQVYEVGEHKGKPYFSLEFCAGGSLADKLSGTPLPPAEAAPLVETLARAIHAAHQKGVIHRDLKPANVLRTDDGTPKITDFGLAKKLDETGQTASGSILGSPPYMAPEQASGKTDEIGTATDVYALGAILYECLTGRPPFRGATVWETVAQVMTQDPVPPAQLQPLVPADLETICLKCLQKIPARRYPSAQALADDLGHFLKGEPIAARPVSARERLVRWCRRRPLLAGLIGAVAALLVLVAVVASIGYLETSWALEREASQRAEAQKQRQAAQLAEETAREEAIRVKRLLYVANLQLASHVWNSETGTAGEVRELLMAHLPQKGEDDLRDFSWRYLWRLLNDTSATHRGHAKGVAALALRPDGSLVTLDGENRLRRWRAGEPQALVKTSPIPGQVVLAPDGLTAAAAHERTVRFLDTETGRDRLTVKAPSNVSALTYLPDGRTLLTRDAKGTATLWDTASGNVVETIARQVAIPGPATALSPDGRTAAVPTGPLRGSLALTDWRTGKALATLRGGTTLTTTAYSPDGKRLASGLPDGTLTVWDTTRKKEASPPLRAHVNGIARMAFSPDGSQLAVGFRDGLVVVCDLGTREILRRFKGHTRRVTALQFVPGGKALVSGSADGTARRWDLGAPASLGPLLRQDAAGRSLVFTPDGRWLATAEGSAVRLWEVSTGQPGKVLRASNSLRGPLVFRLAFSPDGKTLAAGDGSGHVRLWDWEAGRVLHTLEGPEAPAALASWVGGVGALAFSPDGALLAAGFGKPSMHPREHPVAVRVWVAASGKVVRTFQAHNNSIHGMAFSADGTLLATASEDMTARLWRVGTWEEVRRFTNDKRLESVALSCDGRWLATGAHNGPVQIWDLASGQKVHVLRGHAGIVFMVAFSPDGKTLASAGDRTVRLWDVISGRSTLSLFGHTELVTSVAFTPDGNALAAGGRDRTVWLWRAAGPDEVAAALVNPPLPHVDEPPGENPAEETPGQAPP